MIKPRPYQADGIEKIVDFFKNNGKKKKKPHVYVAPVACHARGEKVLTINGELIEVEKLLVGQKLMGDDSLPRVIKEIHTGIDDLYKLTLRNGIEIKVNSNHILFLEKTGVNYKDKYEDKTYPKNVEVSVKEYLTWAKSKQNLYKLKRTGVKFNFNPFGMYELDYEFLTLPPYFLGLWLGDGCKSNPHITTADTEIIIYLKNLCEKFGYSYKIDVKKNNKAINFKIIGKGKDGKYFRNHLKNFDLIENKHIPQIFLTANTKCRKELLAGLIDSDGERQHNTRNYAITLKDENLINQIYFLANSLGYCATKKIKYKSCTNCKDKSKRKYFSVSFRSDKEFPIILDRKAPSNMVYKKRNDLFNFKVEYIGKGEYYGFTVDRNHLYLDEHFIIHHNSGKSIIIGGATAQLETPTIVLQPSKELLEQNYSKFIEYGGEASIFSASVGIKEIGHVTYSTLGSIKNQVSEFKKLGVENVLIDECHLGYSPEKGSMFMNFMEKLKPKNVLGFTATPVRLKQYGDISNSYSQLNFINRGQPTYFKEILDVIPIDLMVRDGYWTPLVYEQYDFDDSKLTLNSTGAEFTEFSIQQAVSEQGVNNNIYLRIKKLLKDNKRHSILVFMDNVENAIKMASLFEGAECVHGKTPNKERTEIIIKFKNGEVKIVTNFGTLTTGFDHAQLDTIIIGRPTNSLALYYQICGRGTRIHDLKDNCLIIDYCNNVKRFGKLEDLNFENIDGYGWGMFSKDRLLTDTPLGSPMKTKNDIIKSIQDESLNKENMRLWFGKFENQRVNDVPLWYLEYVWKEFDFNSKQMNLLKGQIKEILIKNNIKI